MFHIIMTITIPSIIKICYIYIWLQALYGEPIQTLFCTERFCASCLFESKTSAKLFYGTYLFDTNAESFKQRTSPQKSC